MNTPALSLRQVATLISTIGHLKTVFVQGPTGSGKSSMLKTLQRQHPDHLTAYIDAANLAEGDLMIPVPDTQTNTMRWLTNEVFNLATNKPVIVMVDEFSKAHQSIQNTLLPLILERRVGSQYLPEGSIVFATGNLSEENLGDALEAHKKNRLIMIESRMPTAKEWIEDYALHNNVAPEVILWVDENPQCLQSYRDFAKPEDNIYAHDPRKTQTAFVTTRSLETASHIVNARQHLDSQTLTASLIGTIGPRAALDMAAYIALGDDLPRFNSIVENPQSAKLPGSPGAEVMLGYMLAQRCETEEQVDAAMDYLTRVRSEVMALFVTSLVRIRKRALNYGSITRYAVKNADLFRV